MERQNSLIRTEGVALVEFTLLLSIFAALFVAAQNLIVKLGDAQLVAGAHNAASLENGEVLGIDDRGLPAVIGSLQPDPQITDFAGEISRLMATIVQPKPRQNLAVNFTAGFSYTYEPCSFLIKVMDPPPGSPPGTCYYTSTFLPQGTTTSNPFPWSENHVGEQCTWANAMYTYPFFMSVASEHFQNCHQRLQQLSSQSCVAGSYFLCNTVTQWEKIDPAINNFNVGWSLPSNMTSASLTPLSPTQIQ